MKIKRIISLALAMLMLLTTAMFVSCSAVEGNKSDNYYSGGASNAPSSVPNEDLNYDYSESVKGEDGSIDFDIGAPDSVQKIIWSCSMVILLSRAICWRARATLSSSGAMLSAMAISAMAN